MRISIFRKQSIFKPHNKVRAEKNYTKIDHILFFSLYRKSPDGNAVRLVSKNCSNVLVYHQHENGVVVIKEKHETVPSH